MNFQVNKTTAFIAGASLVIASLFDPPLYVMGSLFFGGAILGVAGAQVLKEVFGGPHLLADVSVVFPEWVRMIFWFLGAVTTVLLFTGITQIKNII
ncbi:MAG: hypothetical protein AAF558_08255 [Verrucomicrobiota bacterium]